LLRDTQKPRANGIAAIGGTIPEGQRNDTLMSLAGTMRRRGMGAEEIEAALLVTDNKRCDPPLPEDEVRKIAFSVCRYKPAVEVAFR
jgi:putative DNA primase/helicase